MYGTQKETIEKVLLNEDQIAVRVAELGRELGQVYRDKLPLIVCVLRGAAFFCTDLCRKMDCDMEMDFIAVSSYGHGTASTGAVKLVKDLTIDVTGRDVVVVEDIIDTGLTLQYLTRLLQARGARSVKTVAFLDKKERRTAPIDADYVGYVIPNEFVIGYGLDYMDRYRNLPYIGVLKLG